MAEPAPDDGVRSPVLTALEFTVVDQEPLVQYKKFEDTITQVRLKLDIEYESHIDWVFFLIFDFFWNWTSCF